MARQAGAKFPELVAAQWALESAWGSKPSGQNNMFGLKGGGSSKTTQEFVGGQWKTITDSFLDFQNVAEGVQYLVDRWYKNFKGYTGVNAAGTREAAAQMLSSQGYATDPAYANKLIDLMRKAPANAAMGAAPAAPVLPPPAGAAAAAPAAREMPRLTKGGMFQGFKVSSVPGEGRAYRNGIHEGYDFETPIGTAISYAIGGIVKRIDRAGLGNAGKVIEVELENGVIGYSAHLSEVLMEVGQRFTANQIIAKTGATGAGTGPHLHQESEPFAYKQGKAAESLAYLQLGGTRLPASGARHAMARAGQGAEFDVEVAQLEKAAIEAEALQTITQSLALSIEQLRTSIASQVGEIFPVEQMQLEAALLKQRNKLLLEGAPEEYITAQEKLATGDMERAAALGRWQQSLLEAKNEEAFFASKLEKGGEYVALYTKQLENARARVKLYEDAIAKLPEKQSAFTLEVLKSTLAQLQNADALKKVQEAIGMIERVVGDAMGSYKNFLVNVAKGEGLTKSLKEFQNALRDQALTMFFDFAMKPMQKFLEDELKKVFNLPIEDQVRQEQIRKLQEQINATTANTTAINANTSAQGGTPTVFTGAKADAGDFIPFAGGRGETETNKPFSVDFRAAAEAEESARAASESIYQLGATLPGLSQGAHRLTSDFATSATQIETTAKTWQQNLGATVQAIGMAAASIASITAGISQLKKGGTSNVLTGIGSIMMGVGGALGGFSRLFPGATPAVPVQAAANGAVWQGGFRAFANGGVVNGPTLGLVGEGKYNEAIVPLPDGRSIPVKMAGDSSARSIMERNGQSSKNAPSTLSLSFETTKIGGVEYVSREQLELAMAATRKEAVREGASRGMNMTMDKIKNSPSTRNSLGMGRR
jgi:murein DD-endopeptidase MepM/ murein hydrolase activator NlpD